MLDHLDPFRRQSVALALYRMLTRSRFYVSVVRDALDAAGVTYNRAAFETVRLHNGASYAEMPARFHATLAAQTLSLFQGRPVLGDGFLKDLASPAPSIQALVPVAVA